MAELVPRDAVEDAPGLLGVHPVHVQLIPLSHAYQPPGGVDDDVHVGVTDGGENPLRRLLPGLAEARVDGGKHDVQFRQDFVRHARRRG